MRISLDIPRAVLEVRTAKQRGRIMARELRAAASKIEKGEGKIDFYISMGDAYGPAEAGGSNANTSLNWRSAEQIKREKREREKRMKDMAVNG